MQKIETIHVKICNNNFLSLKALGYFSNKLCSGQLYFFPLLFEIVYKLLNLRLIVIEAVGE